MYMKLMINLKRGFGAVLKGKWNKTQVAQAKAGSGWETWPSCLHSEQGLHDPEAQRWGAPRDLRLSGLCLHQWQRQAQQEQTERGCQQDADEKEGGLAASLRP